MSKILLTSFLLLISALSFGEDIELYVSEAVKFAGKKTQVLIIFDNSGSMKTQSYVKEDYNPNTQYPALGSSSSNDKLVYFTKGGSDGVGLPAPDNNSESRRFSQVINSCYTSRKILNETGFYTCLLYTSPSPRD